MQGLKGVAGVELIPLDLNSTVSIREAVAQVVSRAGRIDILVREALSLSVTSGRTISRERQLPVLRAIFPHPQPVPHATRQHRCSPTL